MSKKLVEIVALKNFSTHDATGIIRMEKNEVKEVHPFTAKKLIRGKYARKFRAKKFGGI